MSKLIAICGLDCEKCQARIATVNNDEELRKKVASEWSELNEVQIKPEMINCLGCRVNGPKTYFCEQMCPIRQCALARQIETCAQCDDFATCPHIQIITNANKEALDNLLALKK